MTRKKLAHLPRKISGRYFSVFRSPSGVVATEYGADWKSPTGQKFIALDMRELRLQIHAYARGLKKGICCDHGSKAGKKYDASLHACRCECHV
jgi:hypothetical protein